MADRQLADQIEQHLISSGASLVGFADMSPIDPKVRHGLPYGISIAVALDPRIVVEIHSGPTADYAAEYDRTNDLLDHLAESCAEMLRTKGYEAVGTAATLANLDVATLSTPLPHKTVATRAGLGWVGKSALLVTEQYGSAVRLGTVLTDAPLPVEAPVAESRCGDCCACVDVCPGSAPTGDTWNPSAARSDIYDAFACFRTAKALSGDKGIQHIICGICIAACPWTKAYLARSNM